LLAAFAESLATYSITLRFFSGSWEAFEMDGAGYDLVLASETIYRLESLRPLARVLRRSCERDAACLVAAKVLYFGVGGGVAEFVRVVESMGGTIESAWERNVGVGRRIMRVVW
jgi:protein-histidine N-methyltransferase